jgi:CheY-like chemotaxis protein
LLRNIRILIVEDNLVDQLVASHILRKQNAIVACAVNGAQALDMLNEHIFDLILTDMQVPGMNGYEITAYIRNTLKRNTPIIAVTADVFVCNQDEWKAAGMNGCISKPFDADKLYGIISAVLVNSGNNSAHTNV